ncbi:HAD family hydrolase [Francisella tularensis]|nr:HAD family hydrolase [Francisella tularensis]
MGKKVNLLGLIHLKDMIIPRIKELFVELRKMGVHTVMITEDNSLTAAANSHEAGVNAFHATASPHAKLAFIINAQTRGNKFIR